MTEKLPSIDEFYPELPSVDDLITEEKLPSVDEFIEPPRPEEEIADEIRKSEEPVDTAPCSIEEQYTEFVRLVNDVREDIPDIPEIKYYDEQLSGLEKRLFTVKCSILYSLANNSDFALSKSAQATTFTSFLFLSNPTIY